MYMFGSLRSAGLYSSRWAASGCVDSPAVRLALFTTSVTLLLLQVAARRLLAADRLLTKVFISDRSGQTAGLRYRYTGPVSPVTGRNQWNSNLNSNFAVQPVRTGIPVSWVGLPAGLAGLTVGLTGNRPNSIFFV